MINKILDSAAEAVADIADGSCILVSGFDWPASPVSCWMLFMHRARVS